MKWVFRINHVLLFLFAFSSGVFKIAGAITNRGDAAAWWEQDNHLFAHLGLSVAMVGLFGVIQAAGAVGTWIRKVGVPAAAVLVACNLFATIGLFVAGVQPFGVVSFLFVAMASLEVVRARRANAS